MSRTAADLEAREGDCLILCRDAGDPGSLPVRLRKFVKRLARAYSVEVVRIEDIKEQPMKDRPRITCLCGSTRFKAEYEEAMRKETLASRIVLTVGLFGHLEGIDMTGPVKAMLDELHLRKIDLADEVLVIDVAGYVGASTAREIAYAQSLGKPVRFWSKEQPTDANPETHHP